MLIEFSVINYRSIKERQTFSLVSNSGRVLQAVNIKNAQLVFTTHETSILSQDVFRRDQIWFTEKDEYNATTLYPLSDFKPRKDVENLEKNYLQGRYGALPYFRDIANLWDKNNRVVPC